MTKRKYCYEFTEHRQYKCCECGRTMHKPTSHYCNGQLRKHNLKFTNMKQFSLEEYLKRPSRKVVTRDGRNVRILCTDRRDADYPIVDLIESTYTEAVNFHTKDGKYFLKDTSNCDLFFAPIKKEGWMHIYKHDDGHYEGDGAIYNTKEQCEVNQLSSPPYHFQHLAIAKIEWEE